MCGSMSGELADLLTRNNFTVPAEFSSADFKVFVREDGKEQLTYKGWPLYYFVKDQKARRYNRR